MQNTKTNIVVARYTKNTDFVNKFKKIYENIDIIYITLSFYIFLRVF